MSAWTFFGSSPCCSVGPDVVAGVDGVEGCGGVEGVGVEIGAAARVYREKSETDTRIDGGWGRTYLPALA